MAEMAGELELGKKKRKERERVDRYIRLWFGLENEGEKWAKLMVMGLD